MGDEGDKRETADCGITEQPINRIEYQKNYKGQLQKRKDFTSRAFVAALFNGFIQILTGRSPVFSHLFEVQ